MHNVSVFAVCCRGGGDCFSCTALNTSHISLALKVDSCPIIPSNISCRMLLFLCVVSDEM